jgi:hypothetical protein
MFGTSFSAACSAALFAAGEAGFSENPGLNVSKIAPQVGGGSKGIGRHEADAQTGKQAPECRVEALQDPKEQEEATILI